MLTETTRLMYMRNLSVVRRIFLQKSILDEGIVHFALDYYVSIFLVVFLFFSSLGDYFGIIDDIVIKGSVFDVLI